MYKIQILWQIDIIEIQLQVIIPDYHRACAQTESESQSQRPGEYMVDLLGKKCDAPEQSKYLNERGNLLKMVWMGIN